MRSLAAGPRSGKECDIVRHRKPDTHSLDAIAEKLLTLVVTFRVLLVAADPHSKLVPTNETGPICTFMAHSLQRAGQDREAYRARPEVVRRLHLPKHAQLRLRWH